MADEYICCRSADRNWTAAKIGNRLTGELPDAKASTANVVGFAASERTGMMLTHHGSTLAVRTLVSRDVPAALELSTDAGWNQTAEDWRTLLKLAPDTCFAIETGNVLAATATLVLYGKKLAWLGMVLTRAGYRGRGYARRLVQRALEAADEREVGSVKLDATAQGAQLYRKVGFRVEQNVERWTGYGLPAAGPEVSQRRMTLAQIQNIDREIQCANRSELIHLLAARSQTISTEAGFAMHRPGIRARYLGPCAAASEQAAVQLIRTCLAADTGMWFWDLLPANTAATAIAKEFGFRVDRHLVRMIRGADLPGEADRVFGIAGFEIG